MEKFCKAHGLTVDQFYGTEKYGGSLDLSGLTSIPEGFNPTVGGSLDLSGLTSIKTDLPDHYIFSWKNGKYIMLDGILSEVISKKGGNYKIKIVGKTKESYLVIEGKYSAHGETLKKAKEDLNFKIVAEKLKNEPIQKDTVITINHYRLITGACEQGVKSWMQQNNFTKEKIKASELLPILEKTNAYGLQRFKSLITF